MLNHMKIMTNAMAIDEGDSLPNLGHSHNRHEPISTVLIGHTDREEFVPHRLFKPALLSKKMKPNF